MEDREHWVAMGPEAAERFDRFQAMNRLMASQGLEPLLLDGSCGSEAPKVVVVDQQALASELGLDVMQWKAICGDFGEVLGLKVNKSTFRRMCHVPVERQRCVLLELAERKRYSTDRTKHPYNSKKKRKANGL
jgi:hypothetical protein